MSTTIIEEQRARQTTPTWQGETEVKQIFIPTGQFTSGGKPKLRRILLRYVILTGPRGTAFKYVVTHTTKKDRKGEVISRTTTVKDTAESTDDRGTHGPWGTREGYRATKTPSQTPTSWIWDVKRWIGEDRARALLEELGTVLQPKSAD